MKKLLYIAMMLLVVGACTDKKDAKIDGFIGTDDVPDSTVYGVCGDGTMMNTLELITAMNDTLVISICDEGEDSTSVVGGMMCGDRMAVTLCATEDGYLAHRVINLTSLFGKWSSIDKNFEITEDGEVHSMVAAESNAWTAWRILNGQLLLNRDTFDILTLGADSLELENAYGIFCYKRSRAIAVEVDSI